MINRIYVLLLLVIVCASFAVAQDTVYVASDIPPGEGNLNNAITANIGNLNSKVFKLEAYGLYILSATVTVPIGQHLTIVGPEPGTSQATAPAQILWTSSSAPDVRFNFDCYGDITMKHVWLFYARTNGAQAGSSLEIEDDSSGVQNGYFEGVIFDYAPCPQNSSGAIGITAPHFRGTFRNCYFRNCTDTHFRYYGRAMSYPFNTTGWHTDSVSFVNCTFANMGYVFMQEGAEYGDFVWFNHCTFINSVMFTLQSPWWWWLSVTNSVYVNAYMFGDIISQRGGGEFPNGGAITIDSISTFGFSVPFTENQRHILFAHNSYFIEQWLVDYMAGGNAYSDTATENYLPHPQPMMNERTISIFNDDLGWPYVSMFNNYDNTNPNLLLPPTNVDAIKDFLLRKWTDNSDHNWAFDSSTAINGIWPLNENLRVSNTSLRTAAMGGFPLGDLYHWDKSRYNAWVAQEAAENAAILEILTNGVSQQTTEMMLQSSWNLVSIPLTATDMRKSILFPSSSSDAFEYLPSGYASKDTLENCVGYWIKYASPTSETITGTLVAEETLTVNAGWNMIGSLSYPLLVSSVIAIPPTSITSEFFAYDGAIGYFPEDTLKPGIGYWVKVTDNGNLVLKSTSVVPKSNHVLVPDEGDDVADNNGFSVLTVKDKNGIARKLLFSCAEKKINLDRYELPPPPPGEILDVRFSSQRSCEVVSSDQSEFAIRITGGEFPMVLAWEEAIEGAVLEVKDIYGKVKKYPMDRSGSVRIDEEDFAGAKLVITKTTVSAVPQEYALHQNYPNPFNPETRIDYSIPKSGRVSLKVYDLIGREVTTLYSGVQAPGNYIATFNGTDFPAGIYFYKLEAGSITITKKLVILK